MVRHQLCKPGAPSHRETVQQDFAFFCYAILFVLSVFCVHVVSGTLKEMSEDSVQIGVESKFFFSARERLQVVLRVHFALQRVALCYNDQGIFQTLFLHAHWLILSFLCVCGFLLRYGDSV